MKIHQQIMPTMMLPRRDGSAAPETGRISARRQFWAKRKSFRRRAKKKVSPVEDATDVATSSLAKAPTSKIPRSESFRIFRRQEPCIFLPDVDDYDDISLDPSIDPSVCSAPPELTSATENQSFTLQRSASFQLDKAPCADISFQTPAIPTKPTRAASVLMKEDALDNIVFASTRPASSLSMKFLGLGKASAMVTEIGSENSRTDPSTNGSSHSTSHSDEADSNCSIAERFLQNAKMFDCEGGKVSFGLPQIATVQSWKGEDLWWTRQELKLSHASQTAQLIDNRKAKRYLERYQEAQEELQLSQIYNVDGKPYLEKLPGRVRKGLREGHAGLEVFSSLESRRRIRGRAIVRSVIDFSSRTDDPIQLRKHSERLNAPNLYWANMLAKAHQKYDRYIDM